MRGEVLNRMYTVSVRDHFMVAHSLRGEVFGPARSLHGATYVIDTEYASPQVDRDGIVIDIGLARRALKDVIGPLNYRNLDELEELRGRNTTTEFLCRHLHDRISHVVAPVFRGRLKVTLHESHVARASYEGEVAT